MENIGRILPLAGECLQISKQLTKNYKLITMEKWRYRRRCTLFRYCSGKVIGKCREHIYGHLRGNVETRR
jgi:hypothetical protein